MAGGIVMTILQTLITRRIAGRAAGVAVRGGGGLPGLLMWLLVSYLVNKFFHRGTPAAGPPRAPARR